jgi:glycosyltransferase involved in cell wall biosynthesis
MEELITVTVTTYNRKDLLPKVVASVRNQTYKNIEVLIIDDCSTDGTVELINSTLLGLDERIRCVTHSQNLGLAAARNTAIASARGKYIAFIDDDDKWEKNFIEAFYKLASTYEGNTCFCCGNISPSGERVPPIARELSLKEAILQGWTPPVASQFYRVDMLRAVNGYNVGVRSGVDHDLWITLAAIGCRVVYLDLCLSTPDAFSRGHAKMTTVVNKRITGIENSLLFWKPKLVQTFGQGFYKHFISEYRIYLLRRFLRQLIQDRDGSILAAFAGYYKFTLLNMMFMYIYRRIVIKMSKRSETLTPLFKPFK